MQKSLPLFDPIEDSYPYHANLQSVILGHPDAMSWILNYYVQIYTEKEYALYGLRTDFCMLNLWRTCPFVYYQRISRELIASKWSSVVEFIIDSINLGNYVYFLADTTFISEYKEPRVHDIFIHGYNLEQNTFYASDHFNGKYIRAKVSFSEIERAYNHIESDWIAGVELIKLRNETENIPAKTFLFKMAYLVDQIKEYMNSTQTCLTNRLPGEYWYEKPYVFGMDNYNLMIDYLEALKTQEIGLDVRPFHVMYSHKRLMTMRIQYLASNNYLTGNQETLINEIKNLENKCLFVRNQFLKYHATRNKEFLTRTIQGITELQEEERKTLQLLLESVKD